MGVSLKKVSLNLPFGLGGVEFDVSKAEALAAWQLYVEYATRVTSHPLMPGVGSVRETLDSVHSLFGTTREILRAAGPEVGDHPGALGPLAIEILNQGLRPFLERWHTELEPLGKADLSADRREAFDQELEELRQGLEQYVDALAEIAGIKG